MATLDPELLGSTVGNIAYGQTTLAGLEVLSKHPQVEFISKQRRKHFGLDKSVPNIKANQVWSRAGDDFKGYTGRGVIIGIVDGGIDFKHQVFRKADGTSRIINIWDQTLTAQGGETVPGPIATPNAHALGYGVEYERPQINDTLTNSSPTIRVRHVDEGGHGTHVAGIAAGDGSQSGRCHLAYHYVGVAPDADIIAVRMWGLSESENNKTPPSSSNFMLDAIAYIMNRARKTSATQPIAINLSIWDVSTEMDGTSADCQAVDTLLTTNSARTAIVFVAGNAGNKARHAAGSVPAGPPDLLELQFELAKDDEEERTIVITYTGTNLTARLTSPIAGNAGIIEWVAHGDPTVPNTTANGPGGSSVTVSNLLNKILITITPPPGVAGAKGINQKGDWTLELQDTGSGATPFRAFSLGSPNDPKAPRFKDHITVQSTLSSDGSGKECITVGNYRLTDPITLAPGSSRGPTLDGRTKPDVCAPGTGIFSAAVVKDRSACARCCCDCCDDAFYVTKSGTSMAAPHVTGLIALMLHKNPTLTHTQIKQFLIQNAHANSPTDSADDNAGWGAGRVDAQATVGNPAIVAVNPPVAREALAPEPLAALHTSLRKTKRGPTLEKLFETYGNEVWALIQGNRKVATIWHRCNGPIWVRFALRAAHEPERPVPFEADGLTLIDALRRFGQALKQFGSQALRQDIEAWESEFALLRDGMSLKDIIETIGNHSAAERFAAAPA